MDAFITYIETLAGLRGMTLAEVQDCAGVRQNYWSRLRNRETKVPSVEVAAAFVQAVRGDQNRAMGLILDRQATSNDGETAARLDAANELTPEDFDRFARFTRVQRQAFFHFLDTLEAGGESDK
jgi:transcriptional regulator with XRE-family HTH domain